MCNICSRIGTRYADQLPVTHRLIVDAARRACNFPRIEAADSQIVGGIAVSAGKASAHSATIISRTLLHGVPQIREIHESVAIVAPITVFAFETRDDRWPVRALLEEVQTFSAEALVLRILHKNANVQYLSVNEALSHYISAVAA